MDSASPRTNQYEHGRCEPGLEAAVRIAALLRVPLAYLYCEYCEDDGMARAVLGLMRVGAKARMRLIEAIEKAAEGVV